MEIQRDRTELLASCSPNAPIKHAPGLLSPPLMADDKDSIYTFTDNCKSDNENETLGKCTLKSSPLSNDIDSASQSNDTQSPTQSITSLKKTETPVTDTPSSSPLQSVQQHQSSIASLSSPSHSTDSASIQPNGSISSPAETSPVSISPKKVLSGKPKAFATANKSATKKTSRGRPKRKPVVYQSHLTDNKVGIKICLKKSAIDAAVEINVPKKRPGPQPGSGQKANRKRQRKSKYKETSDSDDSEYEKKRRNNNTTSDRQKNKKTNAVTTPSNENAEPIEQSPWGARMPEEILMRIFEMAVNQHGCLPTIVNIGRVCSLWRSVSRHPRFWHTLDLTSWTKDRSELRLKWIIQNHLNGCKDLNIANWKVTNIDCVMGFLLEACPDLEGISLAGWKEFTGEHLASMVQEFKSLQRVDLSSVNLELNPNKSAVGAQSLCTAIQSLGSRLTHLYLAHNRLAGIPQIVAALSAHCPNLSLLDLSNISTVAVSHGVLHIEKLQEGCSRLKVLRITNSHITLSVATLQEQMDSPGFPELEELSVASLKDESRLMNDEFLQRILKTSTKLKLLDVRGCARLTHDSLIRLPTWDLKHLYLAGCSVTRDVGSGLELIASKWAHSLTDFDLAWANVQEPLDNAIKAIAEKGDESPLSHLNLCGSSVSLEALKDILANCRHINSINLASCRGLPRGVKRLLQGPKVIAELRENLGVRLKGVEVPSTSIKTVPDDADK